MVKRVTLVKALYSLALLASDFLALAVSFRLAYHLRLVLDFRASLSPAPIEEYDQLFHLMVGTVLATFAVNRLYIPRRGVSRVDLLFQVVGTGLVGFMVGVAITALVTRALEIPRAILLYWFPISLAFIWMGRVVLDQVMRWLRARGFDEEPVLIIGAGESGHIILEKIKQAPELGYRVVGFLDDDLSLGLSASAPIWGPISDAARVIRQHHVGEVLVAIPDMPRNQMLELVSTCTREHVNVKVFPDILQIMSTEVATSEITGLPMLRVRDVALRGWNLALKRAMDLFGSAVALVLLSPLMMLIALLVKVTSPKGAVFYCQERVGLDGKPFQCIKFRSMREDAEDEIGPVWATPDDPRRTRLGAILRRWSLDELPQLINVLIGEMSLVGPRPERPYFVEQFSRVIPRYQERHNEKAGLTGWAQVNGLRGQTSIEERTKYDVFYVENWSLAFDIKILVKTLGAIFKDKNAY